MMINRWYYYKYIIYTLYTVPLENDFPGLELGIISSKFQNLKFTGNRAISI